jgi:hypothetical protein
MKLSRDGGSPPPQESFLPLGIFDFMEGYILYVDKTPLNLH